MSEELNQLKQMFLGMKNKVYSLNGKKLYNPFSAENINNQKERFSSLNSTSNKKLKNNLELIYDEQFSNNIPRNTIENEDINYLNSKVIFNNNKKVPLDGNNSTISKK